MPAGTSILKANGRTICSSRSCVRIGTRRLPNSSAQGSGLRVSSVARQHRQIDAELREGAAPFPVVIGIEEDVVIGSDGKPAVGLDFGEELARERPQRTLRPIRHCVHPLRSRSPSLYAHTWILLRARTQKTGTDASEVWFAERHTLCYRSAARTHRRRAAGGLVGPAYHR